MMSTQVIVVVAVVTAINATLAYLRLWLQQKWRTRRLEMALDGVDEAYRENVIRACGELENGGSGRRD